MLVGYATEYVRTFNSLRASLPPSPYSKRDLIEARIFHAAEGAVIFYVTEDAAGISPNFLPQGRGGFLSLKPEGVSTSPENDQPLTIVLQAATYNHLKVAVRTDDTLGKELEQPPDLLMAQTYSSGSLNPEWLKIANAKIKTTIVGVRPTVMVKGGRIVSVLPTRRHIFSPLVQLPDGSSVLQHTWPFADIFFEPKALDLSQPRAAEQATADCMALRIAANAGMFGKQFSEKPIETSSSHLLRVCGELEAIINKPDVEERTVQEFLEKRDHRYLLRPNAVHIEARCSIGRGRFVPDFTCRCADGDYHFIEIEDPSRAIFQASGGEQAAHLTHSLGQVQDWLRYIDDNRDTVRREDGLPTVYKPSGEVIAGRDTQLNDVARRRFNWNRTEPSSIAIRTYDMLLRDAQAVAVNLARFGSGSQT